MLILSRDINESIIIDLNGIEIVDGKIEIMVVQVRGDKVRIGIEAHKSVPVHRKEVYEAIQRQKAKKS